ncbi:MAG: hypothetical protein O7G87_00655 [bacterium]|nr:hypothetical protein [bacterium]
MRQRPEERVYKGVDLGSRIFEMASIFWGLEGVALRPSAIPLLR